MSNLLFCRICGASLRSSGGVRCVNGCCAACHHRYCSTPDRALDVERAREAERMRLLAALREDLGRAVTRA